METKKLRIADLEVKSFITQLQKDAIRGAFDLDMADPTPGNTCDTGMDITDCCG